MCVFYQMDLINKKGPSLLQEFQGKIQIKDDICEFNETFKQEVCFELQKEFSVVLEEIKSQKKRVAKS